MAASLAGVMPGRRKARWACSIGLVANHGHGIDAAIAAGLEQQRHVEHHQLGSGAAGAPQEPLLARAHQRMHDGFERAQPIGLADHRPTEHGAVDAAGGAATAGESRDHGCDRLPSGCEQGVHLGVGIEHRHAERSEPVGGAALAHGDRAGEAEHDHASRTP